VRDFALRLIDRKVPIVGDLPPTPFGKRHNDRSIVFFMRSMSRSCRVYLPTLSDNHRQTNENMLQPNRLTRDMKKAGYEALTI
jgi:hypothetical protein